MDFLDKWWRTGGALGIGFIILFIVSLGLQAGAPDVESSADEVREYFTNDGDIFLIGDYVGALAFVFFFLPFVSTLSGLLGRAEGNPAIWSRVVFAAGVVLLAFGGASASFRVALAFEADKTNDSVLLTLMSLDYVAFAALPIVAGLFVLAASLVILKTGVLWRWLGWLGLPIAVVAAISGLATFDTDPFGPLAILGFVALIAWLVWTLGVSVQMLNMQEAPAEATSR